MSAIIDPKIHQTVKHETRVEVTANTLRAALRNAGLKVPDHARVYINVPTGGDYSGMSLDIDSDLPIIVTWSTSENSNG